MEVVKNYQVPLIESNMDLLKNITGESVAKTALEKSVEWMLNRKPRMEAALMAAKTFLETQSLLSKSQVIEKINDALEEK